MRSLYLLVPVLATALIGAPLAAQNSVGTSDGQVMRPGDVARIAVWPQSELGGEFPIDDRGILNVPSIGPVAAGGMTVEELRRALESGYQMDMQNPVVTVTPLFTVLVLGQVRSPGVYRVPPLTSWLQVIAMAGGFASDADEAKVRLIRGNGVVPIDGLRAMETGAGVDSYMLQSGDQIVVPASSGLSWRDALQIVQLAATLSLIYVRITR